MASGLDSTKTGARPSHEAIESSGGSATDVNSSDQKRLDHAAMESAKRGQNRIHNDESKNPGTQEFTKFGQK
ncbi:MAG TPA: hypothetical protein VLI45_10595 [Acidobacteriaceae bacterium]|nr:hypothetical protein [Acidobacteriaceae bacterium]